MITLWRHLRDNSGCLYVPEGVVAYILYISTARRQMAWHKQLKKQQLMHRHRDILFCKHTPCLWKGESTRKHTLFQVQWWTVFVVLTSLWPAQRPEIPVLCKIHTNKVVSNVVLLKYVSVSSMCPVLSAWGGPERRIALSAALSPGNSCRFMWWRTEERGDC